MEKILRQEFPNNPLEIIDVKEDLLDRRPILSLINWLVALFRYYPQIVTRTHDVRACFFRTPFIARAINKGIRSLLKESSEEYLFSLQTTSLYDASIPGIPHFVYTDHTHKTNLYYPSFNPRQLFSDAWMFEESKIYQNCRQLFTMSEHVRRSAIDHYNIPPDKIECIFAGSNIESDPGLLDNDNFSNKRIIFVGVDWERKGGPELVNAFRLVLQKHPDATLDIVGCSPEINCPNVKVVGRIPLAEVENFFRKSSVLCVPTKVEPFGIVFVEAFAHKIPVVSSDLGALPQIVEHNKSGYLCDPVDTQRIADHLDTLISSPETCRSFGERGYQRVQEALNWESVGKAMATTIRRHLEN